MVNVSLNHFDAEGNVVNKSNATLTEAQVSDIVDHAAQLVVVIRAMSKGNSGIEAFDQVYDELESSLTSSDVIEETDEPNPVLGLM